MMYRFKLVKHHQSSRNATVLNYGPILAKLCLKKARYVQRFFGYMMFYSIAKI